MNRVLTLRVLCLTSEAWCNDCLVTHLWLRAYRLDRPDAPPMLERGLHREGAL